MVKQVSVTIRGVSPLLMRRWPGEKPTPGRFKKTSETIERKRKAEWLESLYFENGTVGLPGDVLNATLESGAAMSRQKATFKAGVYVLESFAPLRVFSGNGDDTGKVLKGEAENFYRPQFIDIRGVCLNPKTKTRGDRCRPIFRNWSVDFHIRYDDELADLETVKSALGKAGDFVGLCDYRPRFGRFQVVGFVPDAT